MRFEVTHISTLFPANGGGATINTAATMASLTPGVLSKLLENVGNRNIKVAGEHRTALLQVISIVPALVGGDDGDPWRNKGFFLRVSDSVHSAYVSISDEDVDLILSDKIQLGQFIHVARLDSASPVPVLRGVKLVPRRRPCVGEPKDLISSDSLTIPTNVDTSAAGKKGSKMVIKREGMRRSEAKALTEAKAKARRSVCEPSRRLSMENGRVDEGLETRRLSLDLTRRGWDRSPANRNSPRPLSRSKTKDTSSSSDTTSEVHLGRKASSEKNSTMKRSNLTVSPLKNKNENLSQKLISKPLGKDSKSASGGTLPSHVIKVPLSFKTWSDRNVSWDSLPHPLHDLGKQVMGHRNLAFLAAVRALEEASAAESVIQCMSMFAELCQSSQKDSAGQLVEQFLDLHQGMRKAAAVVDAFLRARLQEPKTGPSLPYPLPEICESFATKNAISWVLAAVGSDLSKFCLFKKQDDKMEILNGEKCLVILENTSKKVESENHSPQRKQSSKNHGSSLSQSFAKGSSLIPKRLSVSKRAETEREERSKGNGLKEVAILAKKQLLVSHSWFLNYLEGSLNRGFGLRMGESGCEISSLLRQLKRVNEWLADSVMDGNGTDEKIEGLRKKLYEFLLEHVDSAVGSKVGS